MRVIKFQLGVAFIITLIAVVLASVLEGKFSTLGLVIGILLFFITLNIYLLLELKEISKQLKLKREIEDIENPLVREWAQKFTRKYEKIFNELQQQIVRCNDLSTMMDVYYDVFSKEKSKRILATSMVSIEEVWKKVRGERALEENKKACERGINVERIFIFRNAKERAERVSQEHLKLQKEAGIKVRHVLVSELELALRKDFVVTGSNIVLEYIVDAAGIITECVLSSSKKRAEHFREVYKKIRAASEPYDQ